MKILLREFISLALEGDDDEGGDDRIKRSAKPSEWSANRDAAFEAEIEALMSEPEFKTLDAFVNHKLDNDDYTFSAVELQALTRNAESTRIGQRANVASQQAITTLKQELTADFGFKFVPRTPVKFVRGSMSPGHGTHPFASSGGGGSGFGSDFTGGTFTSFGGGPGAMGGGYTWDKDDPKNLPMGSKRVKR